MLFRFFKRGIEKHVEQKLSDVHKNLSDSFTKVKLDINYLIRKIIVLEENLKQIQTHRNRTLGYDERLEAIENQLEEITKIISYSKLKDREGGKKLSQNLSKIDIESTSKILNGLTDTQKKIFINLFQLQKQLKVKSLSTKSLASTLYAEKEYPSIRSTISEYLTTLYELGLIYKRRKGKDLHIGVTDQGATLLKDFGASTKKEKKIKVGERTS